MTTPILPTVPAIWTTFATPGSVWSYTFQLLNDDGTLMNIIGKTFELVVRTSVRAAGSPLYSVSNTASTASGTITVNTGTSTIQVTVNPAATNLLVANTVYSTTLWMDPSLSDATALLTGTLTARAVTAP